MQTVPEKNRKIDIILVLKPIDGKGPKDVTGLVDRQLFTGGNNLHAKMDIQTCLWSLSYDRGVLPQPLKQKFTGFAPLMKFVKEYMKNRNVEVAEILD